MSTPKLPLPAVPLPALRRPSVSVVVCNYNGVPYVEEALESAVRQSYQCELIVIDDGSTDASREVLATWEDRARVILQKNSGQRAAYNVGLQVSTGDVIIFLDCDDFLERNAAETVAAAFEEGVTKVHFRLRLVDSQGRPLGPEVPTVMASGPVADDLVTHGLLYPSAPASGNAYRRSVLNQLFPLPIDLRDPLGADLHAAYGSGLMGEVRALEAVLGNYRMHDRPGVDGASSALVFGNAARGTDEVEQFRLRAASFRSWISERSGGQLTLPAPLLEFSIEKYAFARAALSTGTYFAGIRRGTARLRILLRALWLRREYSLGRKLALTAWAAAVLLLPRKLGFPVARFVCNPASRGQW